MALAGTSLVTTAPPAMTAFSPTVTPGMMAAPARQFIVPGGLFICSGIARERKDEVLAALNEAGYQDLDIREKGEWAAIAARNPA